jgi:cardiolipin synthase A/B
MPSSSGSDNPMVQHAGHRNFEKLLRCGVRLFESSHTLLHQKIMTVDGVWSAIGSSNFDDRSFETNDELTLSNPRSSSSAGATGPWRTSSRTTSSIR